jgi:PST family polysaccharide transporter
MNVILLGSLGVPGPGVAAYSIAEKIVKAVQAVIRPINQLFLPWALIATKKANGVGPEVFWKLVRLVIPQQLSLLAIVTGTGIVYYASRDWLGIGQRITDISRVETLVTLMLGSVFFGVANNMLGTAGLNHLNERTYYFKALFVSGLTSVLCCIVLITAWGEIGTAVGFVAAEVLLSVLVIKKYFRRAPVSLDGELENREHRIG